MNAHSFVEVLESGKFVVTAELNPPKGTNLEPLFAHAERLKDDIDAFNLTDSHSARMSMAPMGAASLLVQRGIEPIMQVTCRDRNRIALQSDLLAAHALGVRNVLTMTGDTPAAGDHPDAKGVFDVDGIGLLQAVAALQSGQDLGRQSLRGAPDFCVGAVVNPGAPDLQKELGRMRDKMACGARFFQTQAVYDPAAFAAFMQEVRDDKVSILASCIVLRSANMARRLNTVPGISIPEHLIKEMEDAADPDDKVSILASCIVLRSANMARRLNTVPGISIPEHLIKEMEDAADPARQGIAIAGRIIRELKSLAHGIHLIAIGQESRIPEILDEAGLSNME